MKIILTTALIALATAAPAGAQGVPDPKALVQADLIEGWRRADGSHVAGLRLTLAPGWHTYWRAPGDSGIPPRFSWAGSDNIAGQSTVWPVPEIYVANGLRSIVYSDEVVLPLVFTAQDGDQAIYLSGKVELGVCEDVCIPVTINFAGDLPATGGRRDPAIARALKDVPLPAAKAGVRRVACAVEATVDGLLVSASIDMASTGGQEVVIFEHPDKSLWISEAQTERNARTLSAQSEFVSVQGGPFPLNRSDIRITVLGSKKAVDIQGCPAG